MPEGIVDNFALPGAQTAPAAGDRQGEGKNTMKRSELKTIGYGNLTPESWGNETFIILDEDLARKTIREIYEDDDSELGKSVEIATDGNGHYFAIPENEQDIYFECRPPEPIPPDGMIEILSSHAERFDYEDDVWDSMFED